MNIVCYVTQTDDAVSIVINENTCPENEPVDGSQSLKTDA